MMFSGRRGVIAALVIFALAFAGHGAARAIGVSLSQKFSPRPCQWDGAGTRITCSWRDERSGIGRSPTSFVRFEFNKASDTAVLQTTSMRVFQYPTTETSREPDHIQDGETGHITEVKGKYTYLFVAYQVTPPGYSSRRWLLGDPDPVYALFEKGRRLVHEQYPDMF